MKLAIFDFDGTLFLKDTLPFLMKQWNQQKYSTARLISVYISVCGLYLRYRIGLFQKHVREKIAKSAMQKFTRIFRGMNEEKVLIFFERCADLIIPDLNTEIVNEVYKAKEEGFHIVLLSGCYDTLLGYIGRFLGVDTVIGTKMHFKNGLVDLTEPLDVICGFEKVEKIQGYFNDRAVDWEKSLVYADSYSDIELLKLVGRPVVVNPDPSLKEVAIQMHWTIL
ncbi:MAG: HAD family hydrolase [Christensenellales bacterium]|jgi:HAD superfamily hydrolase (TIGR01490 family)